jgi:hypothetical protein
MPANPETIRLHARLHCMEKTFRSCECFDKNKKAMCAAMVERAKVSIEQVERTKAS